MTLLEQIGVLAAVAGSIVAIGISLIKKNPEINNLNSNTIKNLTDSIKVATDNYNTLSKEFEDYKVTMDATVTKLESELKALSEENFSLRVTNESQTRTIKRLTIWVEKLCTQLRDNKIIPATCDPE